MAHSVRGRRVAPVFAKQLRVGDDAITVPFATSQSCMRTVVSCINMHTIAFHYIVDARIVLDESGPKVVEMTHYATLTLRLWLYDCVYAWCMRVDHARMTGTFPPKNPIGIRVVPRVTHGHT